MTTAPAGQPSRQRRSVLGLRQAPGRLALAVMRLPLLAYRHGAGWLLGHTFLAFTHIGRRTGRRHQSVAMVLDHSRTTGEVVICAAWGPRTDWYRNLQARPAPEVLVGRTTFRPEQRLLGEEEAYEVATRFRAAHPWRLRLMSRILAWGDLTDDDNVRSFVAGHPFVAFRP